MSESTNPVLPQLGFARDLSETDRAQLSAFGQWTTADPGTVVIQEGNPQDSLFLIVSGLLHVQTSTTGRPIFLDKLKTGDSIGEINIFDPSQASATVEAMEVTSLWSISKASLLQFMDTHPAAASKLVMALAILLSKRLRKTNEKVAVAQEAMSQAWGGG